MSGMGRQGRLYQQLLPDDGIDEWFTLDGIKTDLQSEVNEWNIILSTQHLHEGIKFESLDAAGLMRTDTCLLSSAAELAHFQGSRETFGTPQTLHEAKNDCLSVAIVLDIVEMHSFRAFRTLNIRCL